MTVKVYLYKDIVMLMNLKLATVLISNLVIVDIVNKEFALLNVESIPSETLKLVEKIIEDKFYD
jgi:hypothetical protein